MLITMMIKMKMIMTTIIVIPIIIMIIILIMMIIATVIKITTSTQIAHTSAKVIGVTDIIILKNIPFKLLLDISLVKKNHNLRSYLAYQPTN